MGDRSSQIERVIARERADLGENLEDLAHKAKALTDWRAQFEAHPLQALGLAAAGGMVLSAMVGRRGRHGSVPTVPATQENESGKRKEIPRLVRDIEVAIGAVATAAAVEFLSEAIPGFGAHFRKAGGISAAG